MRPTKEHILTRIKINENGCWIWQKAYYPSGYGVICLPDKNHPRKQYNLRAHRASYEAFYGPTNLYVLHKCNVKACCNPEHLYAGTALDNSNDLRRASPKKFNGNHDLSKLTDAAIKAIRTSNLCAWDLAQKYGVSQSSINRIKQQVSWKNIK